MFDITIEPEIEGFNEWYTGAIAGFGLAPGRFLDSRSAIDDALRPLDSGLAVSHESTVAVPRQRITVQCYQWYRCDGSAWVPTHKEPVGVGREQLDPISETHRGMMNRHTALQVIGRAMNRLRQLMSNDDAPRSFCSQ